MDIQKLFLPLWEGLDTPESYPQKRPLLAHYSSMHVMESILKNEQVWFANPLFMNDHEEVRFGIQKGISIFFETDGLTGALGSEARAKSFQEALTRLYEEFANQHVMDTYILCTSEHDPDDDDGLLSMWRGYGSNGNGAALVFDTKVFSADENSPFILADIKYKTTADRVADLRNLTKITLETIKNSNIPDHLLWEAAFYFFERLKTFALFTKHIGFKEEREWRFLYLPSRDPSKKLESMKGYHIGPRGVEPKLKLQLKPLEGVIPQNLTMDNLLNKIILGPTTSSPLAVASIAKMLEQMGKGHYKSRLKASSIPFREVKY